MSTAPFVERHRPEDLGSIVLPADIKERLKAFTISPEFLSCVFWGIPGTGKTSSALALVKEYMVRRGIYAPDTTLEQIRTNAVTPLIGMFRPTLFINSRAEGNIDFVKGRLTLFLKGATESPLKFVVIDEADRMTKDGMEALLPLIEQYSKTNRFIFTTNTDPIFGLGPAIVSRSGGCLYEFTKPSKQKVIAHLKKIAQEEGVALSEESFNSIADTANDVREAVGMLGSDIALARAKEAPKIVPLVPEKPVPQLSPVLRSDLQNFLKSLEEFRSKFFTRLRPENRRAGFLDLDNEFEMLFFRWRDGFAGRMKNLEFHRANEPENIRFLGYDLTTEEFKTVRANFLRDPQRGLERLDTAIDYLREIIEGKWIPVPSKLEEALRVKEEKVQLEKEKKQAEVKVVPPAPAPKEATPSTPIPSRTKEEARPPARARITDTDAKTLEESFRAEMALRGIPLKSTTTDYLAVFKAYLREATSKGVSPDRFKSNWLPNIVSSVDEVYSNRTRGVETSEVTRKIINADARFKKDDIVDVNGELRRIIDVKLNADTGTYEYQLEGVDGMIDESLLKPANIPRAKYQVGDNLVYKGKGHIVQDRRFDSDTRKWAYTLKLITVRTGEMA